MYKFSLQTVLDVRVQQEKIKMKEFAIEKQKEQAIILQIETIQSELQKAAQQLNIAKERGVFSIDQLKMYQQYQTKMKHQQKIYEENLKKIRIVIEQKRMLLRDAIKAKKILETLKEKSKTKYIKTINQLEQKRMDEISINKYFEKKHSSNNLT